MTLDGRLVGASLVLVDSDRESEWLSDGDGDGDGDGDADGDGGEAPADVDEKVLIDLTGPPGNAVSRPAGTHIQAHVPLSPATGVY